MSQKEENPVILSSWGLRYRSVSAGFHWTGKLLLLCASRCPCLYPTSASRGFLGSRRVVPTIMTD